MKRFFPGLAFVFALSAVICEIAKVLIENYENSFFPDALMAFGPAAFIICFLFLRKERSLSVLMVICVIMAAAFIAAVVMIDPMESFAGYAAMAAAAAFIAYAAAGASVKPVEVGSLLTIMDVNFGVLILMGFMVNLRDVPAANCVIPATAAVAALFGLILARFDRMPDARDLIGFAILFVCIAAVVAVLVLFAAEPAGEALAMFVTAVRDAIVFIGKSLGRLIMWLISLLPAPDGGEAGMAETIETVSSEDVDFGEMVIPGWVKALPAVIGVIVLVVAVLLVRKIRISGAAGSKVSSYSEGSTSFLKGLRLAIARIRTRLKCRSFLKKNRGSVLGVYYSIEEVCRHTKAEKQSSETPGEFIRRTAALTKEEADAEFLASLPAKVDRAFYSRGHAEEESFDIAYCKGLLSRLRHETA